jgi:hypothetical protein
MEFDTWVVSNFRHRDQLPYLRGHLSEKPWLVLFCGESPSEFRCGSLTSPFRLRPIPFDDCYVDRFFFIDTGNSRELLGSAITMRIKWDGSIDDLPGGWEDTVRRCYKDCGDPGGKGCNTIVGMLVFTLSHVRNKGLSTLFLDEMAGLGRGCGYDHMLVPALAPIQFERVFAGKPFAELASMRRDDGLPSDYWVRLHVRKGARILGYSAESHRFAMSTGDFHTYISSDPVDKSGSHVVRLNRDMSFGREATDIWQQVYADVEHDVVFFNWGCVWVQYDLQQYLPRRSKAY